MICYVFVILANSIDVWYILAMGKEEIISIIRSSKPVLEDRYGVMRLGLFGSCVRDQQREKSDIDLLVSFGRDIDLFDFIDLREFLESRLHHKVDLVMESALKPAIGRRILAEVEYV
jgi:predicted nucleotidyltransferase